MKYSCALAGSHGHFSSSAESKVQVESQNVDSLTRIYQNRRITFVPYIQHKSPLFLFESISPCPITTDLLKESEPFFLIAPL